MNTYITTNKDRQCGSRVYNSMNCHNKIRNIAQNKFENITLIGRHAFNYSVVVENKVTKETKVTEFPNRKEAMAFFALSKRKYN